MARHDAEINLRVDLTEGDITNTANRMAHRIERIFGRSLASGKLSTSTKSLLANLDKGYNKILQLTSELDKLKNTQIDTGQYKALENELASLKDIASELIVPLKEAEMLANANPKRFQSKYDKVQAKVQANQQAQEDVLKQIRELEEKGQAHVSLLDTDEGKARYADLLDTLKATNDQMTIYTERAREAKDLGPNLGVWSDFIGGVFNANHGLGKFLATLTRVGSVVVKGGITVLQGALSKIGSAAKAAAQHLADMAKNLIKSVGTGIIGKLKSLGSAITGVGKSTGKSNNAFKMGFTTLLRYGLGIRSVYFLFRKLRKALGEGLGNLAQYSPAFNTVISNFISSLTQLKNAFATAFAPIINVVAPILTSFINIVSEAVTKVGMLIAALTGQKSFIRAKAVQTDFAASLGKTSSSTDKANKSAEKYKRTLAGFDDVEILKNPDSSSGSGGSGGGGGGGGGTSPGDMFETVAMPSAFEDWAARIKEAWAKADFTDLGRVLGEKIANALDSIPWDIIKGYAGKFGKSFATFLNGLMAVDKNGNSHLATSIGKTIGEAVNTVFTFANEFVSNIDGSLVGNFFADLLNSAISTINWELIADTVVKGINKIFSNAKTFADKFKFDALGTELRKTVVKILNGIDWSTISGAVSGFATGLAKFVNKLITPESFGAIGTTIANALNTAINGAHSFAITFDSKNLGKSIASAINNFFSTFDFEKAGITFGAVITKVGEAITTAVSGVEWQDIGKDLTDFIFSIPWGDVFGTASELASSVSTAAGEALGGVAQGIFEGIQKAIDDYFKEHQGETGGQIALGIIKEIGDYLWKILNWPVIYVVNPIVAGIKSAFGIHSPATNPDLLEAARNIGKGILNGIAEVFGLSKLIGWVQNHILGPVKNAFEKAKNKAGDILGFLNDKKETVVKTVKVTIKKIINKAGEAWEFVKSGAETIVKTVQTILEKVGNWKDDALKAIKAGKETVKKTVEAVFKKVGHWTGEAWSAVKSGAESVKKTVEVVLKEIGSWSDKAWSAFNSGAETVKKTVELILTKIGDWAEDAWSLLKTGTETVKKTIQLGVEKVGTWADDVWNILKSGTETIKKTIQTVYEDVTGSGSEVAESINQDTEQNITATVTLKKKGWTSIAGFIGTSVSVAVNLLKNGWKSISGFVGNAVSVAINLLKDGWKLISDFVGNAVSVGISLWKNGWKAISSFVGNAVSVAVKLWKSGWNSITKYVGSAVSVAVKLWKSGWSKISSYVGNAVSVAVKLWKDHWTNIRNFVGTSVSVGIKLIKDHWTSIKNFVGTSVEVGISLVKKGASWLWNLVHKAKGGIFQAGSWRSIPQYASGGSPHGTAFVAGERGPEIVGHIGGRTEVLNQSQLAAVMYSAVLSGTAVITRSIMSHMTLCTNTVITNLGTLVTVLNFTSSQIYDITNLVNKLNSGLSDIVSGKVVPTRMSSDNADLIRALNTIIQNQNNVVTREELQDILNDAFRRYMNIDFFIGDEQIARHANAGNVKLNRRYGTV